VTSSPRPRRPGTSAQAAASDDRDRSRSIYEGPWRIDMTVRSGVRPPVPATALARAAARALAATGARPPASLGVILSSDAELAALNATHMGHSGPTDVLSFPLLPPEAFPDHPGKAAIASAGPVASGVPVGPFVLPPSLRVHLGDIVVSVERAVGQAESGRGGQTGDVRWSPADELLLLVTHGILHIAGWDHAEPVEERAMRALEQQLLGA
jgi:probable rRNA maturation factor